MALEVNKIYTRDCLEGMKKMVDVMYGGYIIENAMYIQAVKNKMMVKQIPVTVNYDEKSKVIRGIRVVAGVLIFILMEGFKYRLGPFLLANFSNATFSATSPNKFNYDKYKFDCPYCRLIRLYDK